MNTSMENRPSHRIPTMKEIADAAGVSEATVSRALNNHPGISDRRKRQIKELAESMGFEPRQSARTMRNSETLLLGLIVPSVSQPFFAHLIEKLEQVCYQNGYTLSLSNSDSNPHWEAAIVKSLISRQVDGVFMVPTSLDSSALKQCRKAVPTIVLTQVDPTMPSIGVSHEEGGRLVAEHFQEIGCRSVLFVGSEKDQKFLGFQKFFRAQRSLGFKIEVADIGGFDENVAERVHEGLRAQFTREAFAAFDGVFAFNDIAAIGVYHAATNWGFRIPDDFAVCGFDDIPIARELNPSLSSISQPLNQIALSSFSLLQKLIRKQEIPDSELSFSMKPRLVIRGSTTRK